MGILFFLLKIKPIINNEKCARILLEFERKQKELLRKPFSWSSIDITTNSQNFTTEQDIIELLKFNIKQEKKIDPGLQRDLIIVNSDIGSEIGNEFVMSLEGEPLQKGNIRVIQRNNVGY